MSDCADYWHIIDSECDIALEAVGDLNYHLVGLTRDPSGPAGQQTRRKEVFKTINRFLISAGRISVLIWRVKGKRSLVKKGDGHFTNLDPGIISARHRRQLIDLNKNNYLNNEKLRAYFFQHHKLEDSHDEAISQNGFIGPYFPYSQPFMPETPCLYNPVSRIYQYHGEAYDIQEIASAIFTLKTILERLNKQNSISAAPSLLIPQSRLTVAASV